MLPIVRNPAHDPATLAAHYAEAKRLQVRDFFAPDCAEEIHQELYRLPWHLAWNEGTRTCEMSPEQLARLSAQDASALQQKVNQGAQAGYQYLYNHFPLFARYFKDGGQGTALFRFFEWLNSAATLEFLRTLTGLADIRWADGHATLYRAGHFLKYHTDESESEKRRAAYVFNFTKGWGRDWGGLLQFWNEEYDVEHAYRPVFNALNLFTVPAHHSVSAVVPWSPGLRFSITGWLRADDPPGAIAAYR